jgi:hypothetical protein
MERRGKIGRAQWLVGLLAAAALTWAIRAVASPNGGTIGSYTGCLDAKGNITEVAGGTQPLSPCKGTQSHIIRISGGDISAVNTPVGSGLRGGAPDSDVTLSLAPIPAARVRSATVLSIPDNTLTMVPFDTVEFDTAALFNPVSSTRLTAPLAGIYTVSAHVAWPLSTQGSRDMYIEANIGIVFQAIASSSLPASNVGQTEQSISTIVQLSAGDYIQLEVRQNSGGPDGLEVSDHSPTLTMAWLGPSS